MNFLRVAVLALAWSAVAVTPSLGAALKPVVVVTASSAEFSFPVPHQDSWHWGRSNTPENALEYRWELCVRGRGGEYQFGFSLYRFPKAKENGGSLEALLKAGQASIWKLEPDGGASVVADATVSATPGDGCVVIRVSDPASVRLLFGNRPTIAKALTRMPDRQDESYAVSISYRE